MKCMDCNGDRCCGEDCCGGVLAANAGKKPGSADYATVSRKWQDNGTIDIPCGDETVKVRVYLTIARFEKGGKVKYEPQVYLRLPGGKQPKDVR